MGRRSRLRVAHPRRARYSCCMHASARRGAGSVLWVALWAGCASSEGGATSTSSGSSSGTASTAGSSGSGASSGALSGSASSVPGGLSSGGSLGPGSGDSGGSGAQSLPPGRAECIPEVLPANQGLGGGCREEPGEPNNQPSTATPVRFEREAQEVLGGLCDGQEDFVAVTLPAGRSLDVRLQSVDVGADLMLELLESPEATVAAGRSQTSPAPGSVVVPDERITLHAAAAERTPVLRIRWASGAARRPVNYRLVITRSAEGTCLPDAAESGTGNDSVVSAVELQPAWRMPLSACGADEDWYTLNVMTPGNASLRLRALQPTPMGALSASIVRTNDVGTTDVLAASASQADGSLNLVFSTPAPGPVFLRVYATQASANVDYVWDLRDGFCVEDAGEALELGGAPIPLGPVGLGQSAGGVLCGTNIDTLAFEARRTGPATVRLNHVPTSARVQMRITRADLVNHTVNLAAYSVKELATVATFNAVAGVSYRVALQHDGPAGSTPWQLEVLGPPACTDPADVGPEEPANAPTLVEGLAVAGRLCGTEDVDVVAFTAPRAQAGLRWVVSRPRDATVLLMVMDDEGTEVPSATLATLDTTEARFDAVVGTRYRLRLASGNPDVPLDYAVRVQPPLPTNDACTAAQRIIPGTSITATTAGASNDVDLQNRQCTGFHTPGPDVFFRVEVPPGRALLARVDGVDVGAADVALYLLDGCASRCCWAGADVQAGGLGESVSFTNTGAVAQDLVLGVDSASASGPGSTFVLTTQLL